jgi:biotin synthase
VPELSEILNRISGKGRQTERLREPAGTAETRHDWENAEVLDLLSQPLLDLIDAAREVHVRYHDDGEMQLASLLSIKTGACPEDCKYCAQSAHYAKTTGLKRETLLDVDDVLEKAKRAKDAGASRFCMGAAWREVKDGEAFDSVIAMVKGVRALGMEACVTLGMLSEAQASRLAEAGLTAYNHNLDTSPGSKCMRWMRCASNISSGNGSANSARISSRVQSLRTRPRGARGSMEWASDMRAT